MGIAEHAPAIKAKPFVDGILKRCNEHEKQVFYFFLPAAQDMPKKTFPRQFTRTTALGERAEIVRCSFHSDEVLLLHAIILLSPFTIAHCLL